MSTRYSQRTWEYINEGVWDIPDELVKVTWEYSNSSDILVVIDGERRMYFSPKHANAILAALQDWKERE